MMLKELFIGLMSPYVTDKTAIEKYWTEIEKHYTSNSRYYHNLKHLENMLNELQQCRDLITDWETLLFSFFYHDIIYKPTAKDNEEKSAEKAVKTLTAIGYPDAKAGKCFTQIIATKTHTISADNDTNLFTDADLSILGSNWEDYSVYCKQIRKEYSVYPDFMYKPGRRKVLQHFLDMETIFKTPFFRERYEEKAKENLKQELAQLV